MLAEFDFRVLADVDAILNGIATVLIVCGLVAVKRGAVELHKKLMLSAAAVSALFLISYLTYHANTEEVKFQGQGWIRPVYFALLISHIVLAAVQVPLILRTISFYFRIVSIDPLLQPLDLPRHGGLGHAEVLGGPRHAAAVEHGQQRAQ